MQRNNSDSFVNIWFLIFVKAKTPNENLRVGIPHQVTFALRSTFMSPYNVPVIFSARDQNWNVPRNLSKLPSIKSHENPFSRSVGFAPRRTVEALSTGAPHGCKRPRKNQRPLLFPFSKTKNEETGC
jgi:hypothetical protein